MRTKAAVVATGLIVVIGGCGSSSRPGAASSPSRNETALPLDKLALAGVELSPATTQPAVTQQQAEATFGSLVRGIAFRHVTDTHRQPNVDTDAWVLTLDPATGESAGGPPGASPGPATFSVAFVDGRTGALIESLSGA